MAGCRARKLTFRARRRPSHFKLNQKLAFSEIFAKQNGIFHSWSDFINKLETHKTAIFSRPTDVTPSWPQQCFSSHFSGQHHRNSITDLIRGLEALGDLLLVEIHEMFLVERSETQNNSRARYEKKTQKKFFSAQQRSELYFQFIHEEKVQKLRRELSKSRENRETTFFSCSFVVQVEAKQEENGEKEIFWK